MVPVTRAVIAAGLTVASVHAAAQRVTLSCKLDDGTQMVPLNIDYASKSAQWGDGGKYEITHLTDQHVTLSRVVPARTRSPGGDLWLIDRYDGSFRRVAIGLFCQTDACKESRPNAFTYAGVCRTKAF